MSRSRSQKSAPAPKYPSGKEMKPPKSGGKPKGITTENKPGGPKTPGAKKEKAKY